MKIVIAPDSFKHTLRASDFCKIVKKAILSHYPLANIIELPLSDGGEGLLASYQQAVGGRLATQRVSGPYGQPVDAQYLLTNGGQTAILEMAEASGLMLSKQRAPLQAGTYGTGQLVRHVAAVEKVQTIIMGLGGSATIDGGLGMAQAMGLVFVDQSGNALPPIAESLHQVADIINRSSALYNQIKFVLVSDVQNELCGPQGAAHVFGRQKGANAAEIEQLDASLLHYCRILEHKTGRQLATVSGSGAAGGLALPLLAYYHTRILSGVDWMLDTVDFDTHVKDATLVVTGEGRLDAQSLMGKVPIGVASRAKKAGVPVVALVGDIGEGYQKTYDAGIDAIFSTNKRAVPFKLAKKSSAEDLELLADSLLAFSKLWSCSRHPLP